MNQANGDRTVIIMKPAETKKNQIVVNGCKVTLNFPANSENTAVTDIKRMMLSGAVKI